MTQLENLLFELKSEKKALKRRLKFVKLEIKRIQRILNRSLVDGSGGPERY